MFPDFLENSSKEHYISNLINGRIYRKVDIKAAYNECLLGEYRFSYRCEYSLMKFILKSETLKQMMPYLEEIYLQIVKPMGS